MDGFSATPILRVTGLRPLGAGIERGHMLAWDAADPKARTLLCVRRVTVGENAIVVTTDVRSGTEQWLSEASVREKCQRATIDGRVLPCQISEVVWDVPEIEPVAAPAPLRHIVYGDWRDLSNALDRAAPGWRDREDADRRELWRVCSEVLEHYAPLRAQCGECSEVISWTVAYRCADCRLILCERHIRPHFGPNHRPHAG